MTFSDFLLSILASGISLPIGVTIIQEVRYYLKLKRPFNNTTFEVYYKSKPDEMVRIVELKVRKNVILYKSLPATQHSKQIPFEGEFILNEFSLRMGNGFHFHNSENNADGFGFSQIAIESQDRLLVESPFVKHSKDKKHGDICYQAFIWKRKIENE